MKVTTKEVLSVVAEKVGKSQKEIKEVINAYLEEVRDNLVVGNDITLNGVGTLKISEVKAKPEREGIVNPSTGERGMLPAVPTYDTVRFKLTSPLKAEIKEKTSR